MMNVIKLTDIEPARLPDNVLEEAKGAYECVCVMGWDHAGDFDARASLNLNAAQIVFMIELFKLRLLNGDYHE